MSGSVFVRQYHDRLIVESPGGFPSGITLDNILDRQAPRNRLIASILALCGLVERSGQGMNLMYELSIREAKSVPDFTGTDEYYVFLTLNCLILDQRIFILLDEIEKNSKEPLSTDDLVVIDALLHERKLPAHLHESAKRLKKMGVVELAGRSKYVLARRFYEVTGKLGVHTRLVGLDRETCKELIYKHIQGCANQGTPLREIMQVLPSHSKSQVQYLLKELHEENRVYQKGATTASRWYSVK
jgi:ATP-dependent DNA helicase RecG